MKNILNRYIVCFYKYFRNNFPFYILHIENKCSGYNIRSGFISQMSPQFEIFLFEQIIPLT